MYLAIDLGGSKTLLAVFDVNGKVLKTQKFDTPGKYQDFIKTLSDNIAQLTTKSFTSACIALPGKLDRSNGIGLAFGNLNWVNVPIVDDLKKFLDCPVIIENDSKLAALSEARSLKQKYRKVLYITISTGIGGGLIINNQIPPDFQDIEVGQMLLEYEGKLVDWEDFASGRAFQAKFGHKVSETADDNTNAWYWLARNIAIGLIDLMATLNPDVVIIGGGAGSHLEKFQDRLNEELKIYENPMFTIPPIIKAHRAEEAVIYGCYELAKDTHAKAA